MDPGILFSGAPSTDICDRKMSGTNQYIDFVEHPCFGRGPRFTRLHPEGDLYIGWHAHGLIAGTSIRADVRKQMPATFHVTHYFDLERECCDCGRKFIFFAEEQKHWYEELQFGLDSDCVRCVPCRKQQQGIAQRRQQYEELFNNPDRTEQQSMTMAECCLDLIENGTFTIKQTQRIRMLLNTITDECSIAVRITLIQRRLQALEAHAGLESEGRNQG